MNLQQKISISPDVAFQEIGGESVLLHLDDAHYFGLDEVGTRIWQLIVEHGELDAVFERMRQEYDVEPQQLETDLERLIGDLADKGLVIVEGRVAE